MVVCVQFRRPLNIHLRYLSLFVLFPLSVRVGQNIIAKTRPVARLLITGGGSFSSDFGPFTGFENWSSQWLSRGNLDFYNNNDCERYFVVKARIYVVTSTRFYCRAMLYARAAYAVVWCLSVCPSVCHVREFCQNE